MICCPGSIFDVLGFKLWRFEIIVKGFETWEEESREGVWPAGHHRETEEEDGGQASYVSVAVHPESTRQSEGLGLG